MNSSIQETRKKGTKTLISLAIIAVAVYLGFTPLFQLIPEGVPQAVVGSSFGAIFVIILTMFLLNKQTEIEQESKRSERVFDEKVQLYQKILETTREIVEDGVITSTELTQLPFALINLQMLGADETIQSYSVVFEKISEIYDKSDEDDVEISEEEKIELFTSISQFAAQCRTDLAISEKSIDTGLFERTLKAVEQSSESVTRKRDTTKFTFKGKKLAKNRFVHAVVKDYVQNNSGVTFEQLKEIFPDHLQGRGVIAKKEEAEEVFSSTGHKRHFIKDDEIIELADGPIAVSNQWGIKNIQPFLAHCRNELGISNI